MKYITLLLMLALTIAATETSKASDPSIGFSDKLTVTNKRLAAMQAGNSVLTKKYNYHAALADGDQCGKYRAVRTAGVVLLSVGIVSMVGGAAMVAVAYGSNKTGNDGKGIVAFGGAGIGLTALGAALTIPGLICTITGSVKYKKNCRGGTSSTRNFYINPTTANGLGLAATF